MIKTTVEEHLKKRKMINQSKRPKGLPLELIYQANIVCINNLKTCIKSRYQNEKNNDNLKKELEFIEVYLDDLIKMFRNNNLENQFHKKNIIVKTKKRREDAIKIYR